MPKDKKAARRKEQRHRKAMRTRWADAKRREARTAPLYEVWKGSEHPDGKDTNETLKKVSISTVLRRFSEKYPNLVEHLRPVITGLRRPPGGHMRKTLSAALTLSAWVDYADMPKFAPIVAVSYDNELRMGCVATESHAVGDGMCLRFEDYNPVVFLSKTGKVGSLSYRQPALDRMKTFLGAGTALLLDALHGNSVRKEIQLGDGETKKQALAVWLNTGQQQGDSYIYMRVGYLPLFMHEEKAFIVAEDFLPCGAEGTPEFGVTGMEALVRPEANLDDLVAAYGSKSVTMALGQKASELTPLLLLSGNPDEKQPPVEELTFGPLPGFVRDCEARLALASG